MSTVYHVDSKGNVTRKGGGKVPAGVAIQIKEGFAAGQVGTGDVTIDQSGNVTTPAGAARSGTPTQDAPGGGTGSLYEQTTGGGGANFTAAAATDTDAPLGLSDFPTDTAGNPTYVPPNWVANIAPAYHVPYAGAPGVHPDSSMQRIPPTSISDPNKPYYRQSDPWAIGTSTADIPSIQQQLIQAGLLDPKDVHPGMWTGAEAAAMTTVMTNANLKAVSWTEMLQDLAAHPNTANIPVKNPLDVAALADQVIAPAIGRSLSSDELAKFQQAYQKWSFASSNDVAAQALQQPQGQEQVQPASESSFAKSYADENFQGAEHTTNYAHLLNHIHSLLSSGGA